MSFVVTLGTDKPFAFEMSAGYILSLLYLAILGSIATFAAFLTLISRVGAARAGYVGVMVPVVALVISSIFEGFRWDLVAAIGIAISVFGNIVILWEKREEQGARHASTPSDIE